MHNLHTHTQAVTMQHSSYILIKNSILINALAKCLALRQKATPTREGEERQRSRQRDSVRHRGSWGWAGGLARGTSYRFREVMVYRGLALADIQSSAATAAKTQVLCDVDVWALKNNNKKNKNKYTTTTCIGICVLQQQQQRARKNAVLPLQTNNEGKNLWKVARNGRGRDKGGGSRGGSGSTRVISESASCHGISVLTQRDWERVGMSVKCVAFLL